MKKIKRYLSVFVQNCKYMPSILFNTGMRSEYKRVVLQTERAAWHIYTKIFKCVQLALPDVRFDMILHLISINIRTIFRSWGNPKPHYST